MEDGAQFLTPAEVLAAWDVPRNYHPAKPTIDLVTGLTPMKSILAIFDSVALLVMLKSLKVGTLSLPPLQLQSPHSNPRGT